MEPVPNLGEAMAFFELLLQQLEGVHQRLPEGAERAQVGDVLRGLREPLLAVGKAGQDAEAEIAAKRQQAEERLKALAMPEAPAVEAEAGATLGPRLRAEVLQRYARPQPAPSRAAATDDDRITDNVGSIASQWSWDSAASESSAPPPPPPAPPAAPSAPSAPSRSPTLKRPKDKSKSDVDSDLWDDLSRAEE